MEECPACKKITLRASLLRPELRCSYCAQRYYLNPDGELVEIDECARITEDGVLIENNG